MKCVRLTVLTLVIMLGAGCSQHINQSPAQHPAVASEPVEEYWPDGGLRLRKQVLRRSDGTLIDHGTFERWHENGQQEYQAVFVHGKKEGTTVRYHQNGQRSTQQEYRNGERHGRSTSWDATGAKVKQEDWADGRPHGTWIVWKDGQIKWSHTYEHGVPAPVASLEEQD